MYCRSKSLEIECCFRTLEMDKYNFKSLFLLSISLAFYFIQKLFTHLYKYIYYVIDHLKQLPWLLVSGTGSELVCLWHTISASDHTSSDFLIVQPVIKSLANSVGINVHLTPETLNITHTSAVENLFSNESNWVILGIHGRSQKNSIFSGNNFEVCCSFSSG